MWKTLSLINLFSFKAVNIAVGFLCMATRWQTSSTEQKTQKAHARKFCRIKMTKSPDLKERHYNVQ